MRDATLRLFDEFAASFAGGRDPDLRDFLERAGDDAPALAQLVDTFLAGSEAPPASEERTELMRAWVRGEPPILELRKARRLKRGEVVSRLTELLGLSSDREKKVARYYHELEGGLLEPRGVDERVWGALARVLGADVRELARWRPAPVQAKPAYRLAERSVEAAYAPPAEPPEQDEVDRLFLSGS
jgi:hypothetical protein